MKLSTILVDARKALVSAAGVAGEALSLGLLHGTAERWTTIGIGVASLILVYVVPNGRGGVTTTGVQKLVPLIAAEVEKWHAASAPAPSAQPEPAPAVPPQQTPAQP